MQQLHAFTLQFLRVHAIGSLAVQSMAIRNTGCVCAGEACHCYPSQALGAAPFA